MKLIVHYALKELVHNRKFSAFFIVNLSIGLFAFVTLFGFQAALTQTLNKKSKSVLGADLVVSARRPIQDAEIQVVENELDAGFEKTNMLETFSMVRSGSGQSRLFQIKAIENNYPFYGLLTVDDPNAHSTDRLFEDTQKNRVWVYPEVLLQLEIEVGDELLIGDRTFVIDRVITSDQTSGMTTDFAPRIYMTTDQLIDTGLVRPGSLIWYSTLYKVDPSMPVDVLQKQIFEALDEPDIRVYSHKDASQQMARMMELLSDFLGLAAIVALFLAAVGLYFLFRTYLHQRYKQYAILMTLGLSYAQTMWMVVFQVFVLGLMGSLVSLLMAVIFLPLSMRLVEGVLPFTLSFQFDWTMVVYGLALGIVGSIAICLPVLSQLKSIELRTLLQEQPTQRQKTSLLFNVLMASNALLFWVCSMVVANSIQVGSLFFVLFVFSMTLLALVARMFFRQLERLVMLPNSVALRWALKDITRNQFVTMISFVSIGLGVVLLNLIPQVQKTLDVQLQMPSASKIPSFFLFDIQPEQVDPLKDIMASMDQSFHQLTPMVRARLRSLNDEPFEKSQGKALTREEEKESRFRNRGMNLTYQEDLKPAERVIKGAFFEGSFDPSVDALPEISLEKRFARRLGIEMGDKLTFTVESIPVEGVVTSLRTVQWTTFQPNFFIIFQPGVLENAPKTFLATATVEGQAMKNQLQNAIVQSLPNISILDVSRIVAQLKSIMDQMAKALKAMAILCLLAGVMVLYLIANYHTRLRQRDIGLLKALGASFDLIQRTFLWQFGLIVCVACLAGVGISMILSLILSHFIFESMYVFSWTSPIITLSVGIAMMMGIIYAAISNTLKVSAVELFRRV